MKIHPEKMFYVQNGPVIDSGKSLLESLENQAISDDSFNFHIERGDFANWIGDVLKKPELAKSLKRVKNRKTFVKKLKDSKLK
jgi:hypothetical protein